MAVKEEHGGSHHAAHQQSLLDSATQKQPKTRRQKAVRKTCKGTTNLTKLLPSGSVVTFQLLSPIFTHKGQCTKIFSQYLTVGLLAVCAISCFLFCFTDSFRDAKGKVRYGVATFKGLWVIEGEKLSAEEAAKYRIKFIDFFHASMSMLLFVAVALFDQNVIKCFYPEPSNKTRELLIAMPIGISTVCGASFVAFPTKRHGFHSPVSRN
ncbi:hypothetical protein Pint_02331 [Pistacia integerrima]|uniref:Uncharacterized protein n=1 Tax=Pistacia integerrima TaxID=434235 RepID=A0ACC0ZJ63_9ROSI|nr:hypothetical protein Pint_02331 [Pistacia integerrima]